MKALLISTVFALLVGTSVSMAQGPSGCNPNNKQSCPSGQNCVNTKVFGFQCQGTIKTNPNGKENGEVCAKNDDCKSGKCNGSLNPSKCIK